MFFLSLSFFADGTFSIYAAGTVEPFFRHQFDNIIGVAAIGFSPHNDKSDLVAFVDCTDVRPISSQPNCGAHRVDTINGMTNDHVNAS